MSFMNLDRGNNSRFFRNSVLNVSAVLDFQGNKHLQLINLFVFGQKNKMCKLNIRPNSMSSGGKRLVSPDKMTPSPHLHVGTNP